MAGQLLEFEEQPLADTRATVRQQERRLYPKSSRKKWAIVELKRDVRFYTVKTDTAPLVKRHIQEMGTNRPHQFLGCTRTICADDNQLENVITRRRKRLRRFARMVRMSRNRQTVLDLLLPSPIRIDPIVDLIRNVVAQDSIVTNFSTEIR